MNRIQAKRVKGVRENTGQGRERIQTGKSFTQVSSVLTSQISANTLIRNCNLNKHIATPHANAVYS